MSILLEENFEIADSNNIPTVSSDMIFNYVTKLAQTGTIDTTKKTSGQDYKIDYVQISRNELCALKAIVFKSDSNEGKYKVDVSIDENQKEIVTVDCEECGAIVPCDHSIAFLFWIHRKSSDNESHENKSFWSSEMNEHRLPTKVKDIFLSEDFQMDIEEDNEIIPQEQGQAFVNAILDQMAKKGDTDNGFFRHCRTVVDEFEPIYIHHTMLDNAHNNVRDFKSFIFHMEDVSKRGLFEKISDATVTKYKKRIWMEAQYCRIRCSLMERIVNRKDESEDDELLEAIFCTDRENNVQERQTLKEHKRFILKQTEKLENKMYKECGIIINESYPFICASPDGITDDHIVEIKVPKTDEEFEKYLLGKDTISPKYMAQIQVQMYLANVSKALYCVLSPTFEINGALHYVWVSADMQQICSLISCAEDYWKDVVFPRIQKIYVEE